MGNKINNLQYTKEPSTEFKYHKHNFCDILLTKDFFKLLSYFHWNNLGEINRTINEKV